MNEYARTIRTYINVSEMNNTIRSILLVSFTQPLCSPVKTYIIFILRQNCSDSTNVLGVKLNNNRNKHNNLVNAPRSHGSLDRCRSINLDKRNEKVVVELDTGDHFTDQIVVADDEQEKSSKNDVDNLHQPSGK